LAPLLAARTAWLGGRAAGFALSLLAGEFTGAADGFGLLAGAFL
jgi:hypothetical protein